MLFQLNQIINSEDVLVMEESDFSEPIQQREGTKA